jgi:EAL domain-containing protein (putative c-di-GMP-specific phosphodiesterase class I)
VVDAIAPAACGAALEAEQLRDQTRVVQQFNTAAIQRGQQVAINIALWLRGRHVVDAMHAETLPNPFAGITITAHLRDAVRFQQIAELVHNIVRAERRLALAHHVEHSALTFQMRNRKREAVGAAARRIAKCDVVHRFEARKFAAINDHAAVQNFAADKAFDIDAKLRAVLRARTRRIVQHVLVDERLRNGRVHAARVSLPDQNLVTILAEVLAMRFPQRATPRVRRTRAQQHRAGHRRHARPDRGDHLDIRIGRVFARPVRNFIKQRTNNGVAEIVRRAGLALRAAKRAGRGNARRFEPQIETDYAERRFLLHELQSAIALQAFDIEYQPIVAADGGAMVGVEALLRWTHPTRGPITPSVFIPLAEQSGLMSQLGEIVLRRALSDGARWPTLSVAVNLSPLQIRDRWLVDLVANIMAETGIDASRVVLEVTEGVLIDNPQEAQARLEALRALGVRLALDDFGTGYSSLNYLQKFPFDRLKIDRSFVASLGSSGNTGAIIQSIVTLGHTLGMKVLAEGVEKDEQRVLLRLAGCDEMQGYLFAKSRPAADIDQALARATRFATA